MNSRLFSLLAFFAIIPSAFSATTPAVDFDRQVRPILSDNCFTCHGPDEKHRMAGLHFDTKEGAFSKAGRDRAGDSAHSKMYFRVSNPNGRCGCPRPSTRETHGAAGGNNQELDRFRREMGDALGLRSPETAGAAGSSRREMGAQSHRPVRAGEAGEGRAATLARSGQGNAAAARDIRLDRPSADAGRTECVSGGQIARCVRKGGGPAARFASLWRAHGHAVARFRPLRRHAWLSHRQRPRYVALARLGDQGIQRQHAVRPVHDRAACGRPVAEPHAMPSSSRPASIAIT